MNFLKKVLATKAGKIIITGAGAGVLYTTGILNEDAVLQMIGNIVGG